MVSGDAGRRPPAPLRPALALLDDVAVGGDIKIESQGTRYDLRSVSRGGTVVEMLARDDEEWLFVSVGRPDDDDASERVAILDRSCAPTVLAWALRAAIPGTSRVASLRRRLALRVAGARLRS